MKNFILCLLSAIKFDRAIATGKYGKGTAIVVLVVVIPIIVGIVGLHFVSNDIEPHSNSVFLSTLETYLDPSSKPVGVGSGARWYYLIVGTFGVFLLNGILVSMLVSAFESRKERWQEGLLHYPKWKIGSYSVVIGGNEMVPNLIRMLLEDKEKPIKRVLVMTNRDVSALRGRLVSELGELEERVVIYYGERTAVKDLELLHLDLIDGEIYIIGEQLDIDQKGSHHDVKNMKCMHLIAELITKSGLVTKKTCHVMFEYQSTFSVFQSTDINEQIEKVVAFKPFNYYETWAQKVLCRMELTKSEMAKADYLPLEGYEPITQDSDDIIHFIVVGMSRMGMALAKEAAMLAHYPNFQKGKLSRITFIDPQARREMEFMQGHYRELFAVSRWRYLEAPVSNMWFCNDKWADDEPWIDPRRDEKSTSPYKDSEGYKLGDYVTDIEWQFIAGSLQQPAIQDFIKREVRMSNRRVTIAICFPPDNASLAASLYLPDEVYEERNNLVQVLVHQPYGNAMLNSFMTSNQSKGYDIFSKLKAFGMMDSCYDLKEIKTLEHISEQLNKIYVDTSPSRNALRRMLGLKEIKTGKSRAAMLWSSLYSALHVCTKLRSLQFGDIGTMIQPEDYKVLAMTEHMRWNMEQLLTGFAPLNHEEQNELLRLHDEARKTVKPTDDIERLKEEMEERTMSDNDYHASPDNYRNVVEWLKKWDDYDSRKEAMKSVMSHACICSQEILEKIDDESIAYDLAFVYNLPRIYKIINGIG